MSSATNTSSVSISDLPQGWRVGCFTTDKSEKVSYLVPPVELTVFHLFRKYTRETFSEEVNDYGKWVQYSHWELLSEESITFTPEECVDKRRKLFDGVEEGGLTEERGRKILSQFRKVYLPLETELYFPNSGLRGKQLCIVYAINEEKVSRY